MIHKAEDYAMELGLEDILFHVEKTNTSALRLYERLGYKIFRDDGNRYLMGVYGGLWHGKRFI